ncbi:MAG: haloacid dehalogenase-like hydrolase [Deltaproteobacteria bacterium ADurb.Bin510]|nr:MAG: haloacid dehalogenase-like hydrolase [Deltaproteobacteria bacterium ADurb.Bin510]
MNSLALFDFDGTITSRDSLLDFHVFAFGAGRVATELLRQAPWLGAYKLGLISNAAAKQRLLAAFWQGRSHADLAEAGRTYALSRIDAILRPVAAARLRWHRERSHEIAVVSASPPEWIEPWCKANGIPTMIGTLLELDADGKLTGRLATPNCHGPEKVRRIREHFNLADYASVYAYGDSRGDHEMLSLADHPTYRWRNR